MNRLFELGPAAGVQGYLSVLSQCMVHRHIDSPLGPSVWYTDTLTPSYAPVYGTTTH